MGSPPGDATTPGRVNDGRSAFRHRILPNAGRTPVGGRGLGLHDGDFQARDLRILDALEVNQEPSGIHDRDRTFQLLFVAFGDDACGDLFRLVDRDRSSHSPALCAEADTANRAKAAMPESCEIDFRADMFLLWMV